MSNNPSRVSVCLIAYNHRPFIAQAIEGALHQQTRFPYEIVIGDDSSTDGTDAVVADYARRYPGRIRVLPTPKRLGMQRNVVRALRECGGEYVAMLEGDDYWLSQEKLQRQADFLNAHPECSLCYHNVYILRGTCGSDERELFFQKPARDRLCLRDVVGGVPMPTCSEMIRRAVLEYPPELYESPGPDRFLTAMAAKKGQIAYIDAVLGVYRIHAGGIYASLDDFGKIQHEIRNSELLNQYLNFQYDREIKQAISLAHYRGARLYRVPGAGAKARHHLFKCLITFPHHPDIRWRALAGALAWHVSSRLHRTLSSA